MSLPGNQVALQVCLSTIGDAGLLVTDEALVNGEQVRFLRDTGSTVNVIRQDLVRPADYTGRQITIRLINGYIRSYPEAEADVRCPYYTGRLSVVAMKKPVYDLILGQTPEILAGKESLQRHRTATTPSNVGGPSRQEQGAATTRAQARAEVTPTRTKALPVRSVYDRFAEPSIGALQEQDDTLRRLLAHAREGKVWSHKNGSSSRFVWSKGRLYREVVSGNKTVTQLVLPQDYRRKVFDLAHHAALGAHLGKGKTKSKVAENYFWPSMGVEIWRWATSCEICQKTSDKGRIAPQPMIPLPIIDEAFSRVSIDLIGEIKPPSSSGHKYILTLVDHATRWAEALPLKSIDTPTVAEALLSIFTRLGFPKEVLSDNGTRLTSQVMKEVYRISGIKGLYTSVYHPQSNGASERFNGVLKKMLKRMASEQPRMWDRYLNPILFAYRAAEHKSMGFSPFQLMYGREVRGPLHILRDSLEGKVAQDPEVTTTYEYVLNLQDRLAETLKLAREELAKSHRLNAKYFNSKAKVRSFQPGDKVLLLLPTHSNKLLAQWQVPYDILKSVSKVNYMVNVRGEPKVYHTNMIKRFTPDPNNPPTSKICSCSELVEENSGTTLIPSITRRSRDVQDAAAEAAMTMTVERDGYHDVQEATAGKEEG